MRILVTGATGFAGTALIKYLTTIDDADITAIVHKTQVWHPQSNIRHIQSSLEKLDTLLLQEEAFDYIFHLARIPGKRFGNIGRMWAGMQGATANKRILKAIDSKTKLIYLSGSLMYGHNPGKASVETDTLQPAGFAKYYYHAEKPLLDAIAGGNGNIIMLRAPWIIGNGSWFKQLYEKHIQQHKTVPIYGNKERYMSLITVEDCAAMMWHYAQHATQGIYNIYTLANMQYSSFVARIAKAYNITVFKEYNEQQMLQTADKTTVDSVCCEVVLSTNHPDILNSYTPMHNNLETYINQLAQRHE